MAERKLTEKEYKRQWYLKNKERLSKKYKEKYQLDKEFRQKKLNNSKKQRNENREELKKFGAIYREKNREKLRQHSRDFRKNNRSKINFYSSNARARKRNATPPWLNEKHLEEIEQFYWLAQDLRTVSGEEYHVDHIVPLKGDNICGLHVPWNLQILPSDINLRKNKYA